MAENTTSNIPSLNEDIERLLRRLEEGIQRKALSTNTIHQTLNSLKSRIVSPEAAAPFAHNGIETLCFYGFEEPQVEPEYSLVALKCLANVLLLEKKTRQVFVNAGYATAAAKLVREGWEKQLLGSRILFLLTYDTTLDFDKLVQNSELADSIHDNIVLHASQYIRYRHEISRTDQPMAAKPLPALQSNALTETMKLLFNLTKLWPTQVPAFTRTIAPVLEILLNIQLDPRGLQPPITQLINALLNLDLPGPSTHNTTTNKKYTPLFPEIAPNSNHTRLIEILNSAVRTTEEERLEGVVPLVTLIRRIYELAPSGIAEDMQRALLPSTSERAQPLGQSDTLASHLLRLTISPLAPNLRESISCLLFEFSQKDATTFVHNVGYGFAAGFLVTHNLPVPEDLVGSEDSGARLTSVDGREINPITGQMRDMEPEDELPEMTDEEKEREAERLFVLFERLKATGVMEVVNPVEVARREGRFKEVD